MSTRTARIHALRALLHEYGIPTPAGAARLLQKLPEILEPQHTVLPSHVRLVLRGYAEEIAHLEQRIDALERELEQGARETSVIAALRQIPGVGLLSATALYAAVGNIPTFRSGRHLASWMGITPREHSSGGKRRLGRISKQGNPYLRTLLIHGARSALLAAQRKRKTGRTLSYLEQPGQDSLVPLDRQAGGAHTRLVRPGLCGQARNPDDAAGDRLRAPERAPSQCGR